MKLFSVIGLTAFLFAPIASADGYVGNAYGVEGRYQIFEFTEEGSPLYQISNSTNHIAWPSAIRLGPQTTVYASENISGKWQNIRRWVSIDGVHYSDTGSVFSANGSEPYGIGPATVNYDGSTWRMFYLIRGSAGSGTRVGLATSADGVAFTRSGTVFATGSEAPGGAAVSYACTDGSTSYLLIQAYSADLNTGPSLVVSATSPGGKYSLVGMALPPSSASGTITGSAGNNFARFTGAIRIGVPIVVNDGPAPYVPTEKSGTVVWLDRPLEKAYSGTAWGEITRSKADMSFIRKTANGSWEGAVTGYGVFPGVLSEYTNPINASSVTGPYIQGSGYFLKPYFNSGKYSTENPEPIRSDATCN